jgi:hypothetical protein
MAIRIFYSWQQKRPTKYNMWFILDCIAEAAKAVGRTRGQLDTEIRVTHSADGIPGSPNIPLILDQRIAESDIVVGDVTFISYVGGLPAQKRTFLDRLLGRNQPLPVAEPEGQPSPNVVYEVGEAKGTKGLGYQRVLLVMNTEYGDATELPFDFAQTRYPMRYKFGPGSSTNERNEAKKKLIDSLTHAIGLIVDTEHERQKERFKPFAVWHHWSQNIDLELPLEVTTYVTDLFTNARRLLFKEKSVVRLCGLSGIGKTRLLFECFNTLPEGEQHILGRVLYIDENEQEARKFLSTIRNLKLDKDHKILIIDNCSLDTHNLIAPIIATGDGRLSVITVSSDPDENPKQYEANSNTIQVVLQNEHCKIVVNQLLEHNFEAFSPEDRNLLVDFSSGLAMIAQLMAKNKDREKYEPGPLTPDRIFRRLLGSLYTNDESKAVLYACSLFSQLGFRHDLAHQLEAVAQNADLFGISLPNEHPDDIPERRLAIFSDVCAQLLDRQLLEVRGRAYAFRPSPLAVRLAEEWWRTCSATKFTRIIPLLQQHQLVEKFCEQFRYLRHVQNAQVIVGSLCQSFFNSAEVLNSEVGSRLFRSFVYVNPGACTSALVAAFMQLPVQQIRQFRTGRRNIIWSLERLCFRPETFNESINVLAALSAAESENYANNATGQLLQLFHIFLPGTMVDLAARWVVIDRLDRREEPEYKTLCFQAMASALKTDHFNRMSGPEDGAEFDYKPTPAEVLEYWKRVVTRLQQEIITDGGCADRAIGIIEDSFYPLCVFGGARIIVPAMRMLIDEGYLDPMDARKKLQFVINSGRVANQAVVEDLRGLYQTLNPTGFEDHFKIYVQDSSAWEYDLEENYGSPEGPFMLQLKVLSAQLLATPAVWGDVTSLLFTGTITEGFNFGRAIAMTAEAATFTAFLDFALGSLATIPQEQRNISVLIGALSEPTKLAEAQRIFLRVLAKEELKYLGFAIARVAELPYSILELLLHEGERGKIPVRWFIDFNYGWGMRHLRAADIIAFTTRLREVGGEGQFVALFNLASWMSAKEDSEFAPFAVLSRMLVMEDSQAFFEHARNASDVRYYTTIVTKLLTRHEDPELARAVLAIIIEQSEDFRHFHSKRDNFYNLLNVLQERYFPILWEVLTILYLDKEKYGTARFHLKDILGSSHDYNRQSEGLLFGGDPVKFEKIFEWAQTHQDQGLDWIAELLPVFRESRSPTAELHPYAKAFIDEFGEHPEVRLAIGAKMGSFGWMGSLIPKLQSDKAIWTQLLEHPKEEVWAWAQANLQHVNERMEEEQDREAEGR